MANMLNSTIAPCSVGDELYDVAIIGCPTAQEGIDISSFVDAEVGDSVAGYGFANLVGPAVAAVAMFGTVTAHDHICLDKVVCGDMLVVSGSSWRGNSGGAVLNGYGFAGIAIGILTPYTTTADAAHGLSVILPAYAVVKCFDAYARDPPLQCSSTAIKQAPRLTRVANVERAHEKEAHEL